MWPGGMDPRLLRASLAGGGQLEGVCVSGPDPRLVYPPQELHRRYEAAPETAKTKALQTVIEMKVRERKRESLDISSVFVCL